MYLGLGWTLSTYNTVLPKMFVPSVWATERSRIILCVSPFQQTERQAAYCWCFYRLQTKLRENKTKIIYLNINQTLKMSEDHKMSWIMTFHVKAMACSVRINFIWPESNRTKHHQHSSTTHFITITILEDWVWLDWETGVKRKFEEQSSAKPNEPVERGL